MIIKKIDYIVCQMALQKPIPLSCGELTHRNFGLIRIESNDGYIGWGETSVNFPPWSYLERQATIRDGLAPMLIGEDPRNVLRLRDKMIEGTRSFTRMWAEGALIQAISGIEMALWDLLGKSVDLPVAVLLGGIRKREFECYATGLATDHPIVAARDAVKDGYKAIKMRVGFNDDKDIASVRSVREAIGPNVALLIDANQAFDLPRAERVIEALECVNPYWFEEPILSDDLSGLRRLHARFPNIRFAWGENSFRLEEARIVAEEGLADYIMPDPCRSGGLAASMRVAEVAARNGHTISAHHYGSDLGFSAVLHLLAAAPRSDLVLRDIAPVPLRDDIIVEDLRPVKGIVRLPQGSGLGVNLDLAVIEKTRVRF